MMKHLSNQADYIISYVEEAREADIELPPQL
jgi:hypothetical protein